MKKTITTSALLFLFTFSLLAQKKEDILNLNPGKFGSPLTVNEFVSKKKCSLESKNSMVESPRIIDATVYFVYKDSSHNRFAYDENTKNDVQKIFQRKINNNSLENLKSSMDMLLPGDCVVFDNIKTADKKGRIKNEGGCTFILK